MFELSVSDSVNASTTVPQMTALTNTILKKIAEHLLSDMAK